jgi:papain like cysteine protease AvrRpt2
VTWQVPVISQSTINLCWEACGRMLWGWRNKTTAASWANYAARAGAFGTLNAGLIERQMDTYYRQLGIRSLEGAQGKNIRYALKWSPVIITSVSQAQGHAMVVVGHGPGSYRVVNPCALLELDFETDTNVCSAATKSLPATSVDGQLGKFIWYW